jgi:mycothiol system anti-sigma-R factor
MSCGDPHATDCREVIEKVYVYLDGEAQEPDRAKIRQHLEECGPCLRQYGLEAEVKTLVNRCCGGEPAPEGLRDRLIVRLREVRVEIGSVERRAD